MIDLERILDTTAAVRLSRSVDKPIKPQALRYHLKKNHIPHRMLCERYAMETKDFLEFLECHYSVGFGKIGRPPGSKNKKRG